jgi:hypothetical protein
VAAVGIQDSIGNTPNLPIAREAHRPVRGLFPSFADLVADIRSKGGRDAFVEHLANNSNINGFIRVLSRKERIKNGDKDGIIYAIVNLANNKCYVGQT